MEKLKELVENYYYFVSNVLITESELYCNFGDKIEENEKIYLMENGELKEYIYNMILKDILYDFIFNIEGIKKELGNAQEFWYEEYSKNESLKIYEEIKKVFKDFMIEDYENEIKGGINK